MKTIFITGCCGYIGSHTSIVLLENNYNIVGIDDFSNSNISVLQDIEKITNKKIKFYEGNILNEDLLKKIFRENSIDAVLDFAAFKAVGDSVLKPIDYYINNVSTVLTLLNVMKEFKVKSLIFSSSATVYGTPKTVPITENFEIGETTNPYGTSKLFVEKILNDLYISDNSWRICIFRYFNPVGAHPSGQIGENPKGIPANLMPYITKVACGELEVLNVFGNDYNTPDGTGIRDYIHIMDLARAHINGLKKLASENSGIHIYNLGTGKGYSVLEMIKTFERVNNVKVNYRISDRRPGDIAVCYANSDLAKKELGWKAELSLEDMCRDAYNYIKRTESE